MLYIVNGKLAIGWTSNERKHEEGGTRSGEAEEIGDVRSERAMDAMMCDVVETEIAGYRRDRGISRGLDDDRGVSPDIYPPFKTRGDSTRAGRQQEDRLARDCDMRFIPRGASGCCR
jgi:hypothetical protein